MKLFKNILRLLFSILLVFLFIGTWFPMKYIYDNLSYSYLFPFLSFHLYTGLLYIFILFAFFYSSPKGLLSKIIGLILSGLLAYKEYTFYLENTDQNIKYIYLISIGLGILITLYFLFKGAKPWKKS
ncbi:MAG: hypothetical protein QM266_04350 [Bacillota bacterium]|jgi:hypothetical protein|nr:hypothetical protein [Bacillota bacterium]